MRGGSAFSESFQKLRPKEPFSEDKDETKNVKRGHGFSVFRGHLVKDWLFPTFFLDKNKVVSPDDFNIKIEWDKVEFRIRLSRTGFMEIKLTRPIPARTESNSEERLIDLLHDLLQIGARNTTVHSVQWGLGLYCANQFIQALPSSVEVEEAGKKVIIGLRSRAPEAQELPLRLRYTILFFDTVLCKNCGRRIDAKTFGTRDKKILCTVLEGALILAGDGQFTFPKLDDEAVEKLKDLATWENELCVFAPERCLIYYPLERIFLPGQEEPVGPVNYEDYWKCIIRGIEHTVAVRAALQILEWHTTRELDKVPHLTKKITDGDITKEDEQDILHMADEVSNTFNMLPSVRDVLIPTSVFRASFAVNKFSYLNDILRLKDVLQHIERNVDELVIFLNHFTNVRLQDTLQRGEIAIGIIGVLIAVVAFLAAGPSFLQDYNSFFGEPLKGFKLRSVVAFLLMGFVLATMLLFVCYYIIYRPYKRRKILIRSH